MNIIRFRVFLLRNAPFSFVFSQKRIVSPRFAMYFSKNALTGTETMKSKCDLERIMPTQKRKGGCRTFFSRNMPRHPDNAIRLAVWRITLIFHKNFCIIYIQGKGKNEFPEPKIYRKRGLFMHNRQNDFMFEYFIKGLD